MSLFGLLLQGPTNRAFKDFFPRRAVGVLVALASLGTLHAQGNYATPYTFTTPPGVRSYGSEDGVGNLARFSGPTGTAVDGGGNVYVADSNNHTIRKITPAGVVVTLAGSAGSAGSVDGTGSAARFNSPYGVAVDGANNVYVTDSANGVVRKITPSGVVSTLAAQFANPTGLAIDWAGNLYVGETGSHTIRKITATGVISVLAGTPGVAGSLDGIGEVARFNAPRGVAVDLGGNVYVADTNNHTIRKITVAGSVSTLAGVAGFANTVDGTGAGALFAFPYGLAVDAAGQVFVAHSNVIRSITPAGVVSTFAGSNSSIDLWRDGTGTSGHFRGPRGIATDATGNVYVADTGNNVIRKITNSAVVTTIAGIARPLSRPFGVALDSAGNMYIADAGFDPKVQVIQQGGYRRVSPAGAMTTIDYPYAGDALAVDRSGNLYLGANTSIVKIAPDGVVTTLAGTAGNSGSADGVGNAAQFSGIAGLAVDEAGTLYATEYQSTIRKITAAGVVTTLAGTAGTAGSTDGTGAGARFVHPVGIAVDRAGNAYVIDPYTDSVRKITPMGVVTTLAGSPGHRGTTDGTGSAALFLAPRGITVDESGNVYVADTGNNTIRKITPAGDVTTIGGRPTYYGNTDGTGMEAHFFYPWALAVDGAGNIYVADSENGTIRKGSLLAVAPAITTQPVGRSIATGYSVTLSVSFSGAPAPTIQWRRNGVDIFGATAPSYTITHFSASDAGEYTVVATNASGTATSNPAVLTYVEAVPVVGRAADFNGDGKPDLLWQNSITRERAIWFMDGTNFLGVSTLGFFEPGWSIAATGDFNGDGKTDIVWSSDITGERALWLMNGPFLLGISTFGIFPLEWAVAATGDFDGDGQPDLVWSNSLTGERALWLMNGTNFKAASTLGIFPLEWTVAATGDFNADGKPDIVWSNSITGERAIWLMDGTNFLSASTLGFFPLEWTVRGTADFNADGKPDIIWSNSTTGERALWLMNGTNFLGASTLGIFPLEWTVKN